MMWRSIIEALAAHDKRMTERMEKIINPKTSKQLLAAMLVFGGSWTFAWYAHLIGPWVNDFFGWAANDPDSAGKIRWRRIWSTAICLPGLLAGIGLYIRNLRQGRRR